MTTQTLTIMSAHADLVDAYEALRETVVSSGASAATPVGGQCLLTEGLLSWGRQYSASRAQEAALNLGQGGAPQGLHTRAEHPQAAVVSLMATMALQSIDHLETTP